MLMRQVVLSVLFGWMCFLCSGETRADVGNFPISSVSAARIAPPESGWRAVEARLYTGVGIPGGERLAVIWSAGAEGAGRPSGMGLSAYGRSGAEGVSAWRPLGGMRRFNDRVLRFEPKTQGLQGLPPLVIATDNGGGCLGCDGVLLFGFSDEGLTPILPELPPFLFLNGVLPGHKGHPPEVEAIDGRWDRFGGMCATCSPAIPLYYAWSNGRLKETCDAHLDVYQEVIDTAGGGDTDSLPLTVFLAGLQLRWPVDKALGLLRTTLEERRLSSPDFFKQEEVRLIAAARRAASAMASRPCPILSFSLD
ncbi:hypothetical protein CCP2SC5_70014 [Azospirillaceae bacterium]